MRSTSIAILFAFVAFLAQARGQTIISGNDLAADAELLRKAYVALHPGLHRYLTKAEFDREYGVLKRSLSRDQTLEQAYVNFSIFLAKIKCGHTYANFYNQTEATADELFKRKDKLPFYFRWIDNRMIITKDFSGHAELAAGTEVRSIDGVPATQILKKLLTVARADGSNDAKRVNYMQIEGNDRFEAFDVFFPMFFPMKAATYALEIRPLGSNKSRIITVEPLTFEKRYEPIRLGDEARKSGAGQVWDFRILDGSSVAYLKMPSWALFESKWDWQGFLDRTFDRLIDDDHRDLIIDLRGNEGGLSVGDKIISRLIEVPLQTEKIDRLVRYRKVPDELVPYLKTWDPSFRDWGEKAVEKGDGYYRLVKYDDEAGAGVIRPSGRAFKGRVWVLIDASNSSATFEFAQVIRNNKLGVLVGQPTGGNQRGINGGAFFFLRLPNSKIEADVPLIGQFPAGEKPDAGLQPDVMVVPTREQIAKGVDAELEAVRRLIRERSARVKGRQGSAI